MKHGTFSYLPPMTPQQVRKQVEYILARGWNPAIEHTEAGRAAGSYWSMWKLPLFGETSVEHVLAEAEACHKANPGHVVRLIGYDNVRQTLGSAFAVHHA
jgi:ribulose-bisphosphate carboxylase small chain